MTLDNTIERRKFIIANDGTPRYACPPIAYHTPANSNFSCMPSIQSSFVFAERVRGKVVDGARNLVDDNVGCEDIVIPKRNCYWVGWMGKL